PDKRWDFFPVISGGYRISEEKFFKDHVPFISNLKFRGSYGIVGGNVGNPFQYLEGFTTTGGGSYEFTNGTSTTGAASPAVVNKMLTWSRAKITDIGFDITLLNNQLDFTFDVYQRDRNGLLATKAGTLPNTFGGSLPEENLNSDRVQGFDFMIAYKNFNKEFKYGASANFNFNRTMNRYVERGPFTNSMDKWRNGQQNRYNDISWGYVYEGQFQSAEEIAQSPYQSDVLLPGSYKYKDMNGDGVLGGEDMMPIFYNEEPKMNFGLTLNAAYKGFDLNILLQGAAKYTVFISGEYGTVLANGVNTPAYFFDRWHQADPYDKSSAWIPGTFPAARFREDAGTESLESDRWRRDASYVRIKSIELGYTVKANALTKLGIKSLRLYTNGYNLVTFTDKFLKAFDPEKVTGAFGSGYGYPITKIFNFGANINF
ncbi:MAG: TonB-dependent receptor, partial [Sphingobacteriales bacterium]